MISAVSVASGAPERTTTFTNGSGLASCVAAKKTIGVNSSRKSVYFASFTSPTISYTGRSMPLPSSTWKVAPTGLEPPKNVLANRCVTMATLREPGVSRSLKSRPARIGVAIVRK